MKGRPKEPKELLKIGSCVYIPSTKTCGTVGPFVKIKETGELCFLTVRHIFGPFQSPEQFIGTKVHIKDSADDEKEGTFCGHVIAAEYGESLDVALVKICEDCIPSKVQFVQGANERLTQYCTFSFSS